MINLTIVRMTLRALFGRRRFLLLIPLPGLLVGLALLADAIGLDPAEWGQPILLGIGMAVVLPVLSLIIGASVLGSEIDDGTIVHLVTKPLPRREIVLSKLAVAAAVSAVTVGVGMWLAGLVTGQPRLALGLAAGAALGAVTYSAIFLALSVVSRRPVLIGLVYILIWEGLLSGLVSGTRVLSVQHYAIGVANRMSGDDSLAGGVSVPVALAMAGILVVGATLLAIDRMRGFQLAGETS